MGEIWVQRIGQQREWIWRGWQIRYSYLRAENSQSREKLPPLIFLHGFGAAIEHWRRNLPVLSQTHPVYALDLLGFGGSRKAQTCYSVQLWADQVHDFWQALIGEPVILVGNSIGSLVALVTADCYPEMVAGLVMLSLPDVSLRQKLLPPLVAPLVMGIEGLVASPLVLKLLFQVIRRPSLIRRWLGVAYRDSGAITEELVGIITGPAGDLDSDRAFCALFEGVRKPGFAPPVSPMLSKLTIPTLMIWGEEDRMVPPVLAKVFADLNPLIKLIELPGVGHCPHDEVSEQFNLLLLSWLQQENFV